MAEDRGCVPLLLSPSEIYRSESKMFLVYAMISALCFAAHNYLVSYAMKSSSVIAVTCEGFPFTITYFAYLVYNLVSKKKKRDEF